MGNHIDSPPPEKMSGGEKILFDKFSRYDPVPSMVGLYELGEYTQEGQKEANVRTPLFMYWQPNPDVQNLCKNVALDDDFFGCIPTLKAGTKMYKLWGVDNVYTEDELKTVGSKALTPLGYVTLTSDGAMKSRFGDEKILFKHTYWS